MIVKSSQDVDRIGLCVEWGNGSSRRYLTKSDGISFTVTETTVRAGTESRLSYPHHQEACYCVEGRGSVESGDVSVELSPGVLYCVSDGEAHTLRAETDLRLICVFSPALDGTERHTLSSESYSSYS